MAAQRQPAMRPIHTTPTLSLQTPPPADMPGRTPSIIVDDAPILQPGGDNALQRESERQTWFQNVANDALNIPNGYQKVSVLIIRWAEDIDEFQGHDEEIERLQRIFTTKFGYDCNIVKLRNEKKPQLQLNIAISHHVYEHDDPNNLLIVYYTGHGHLLETGDRQRLELSATQNFSERKGHHMPSAFWDTAEEPLKNQTHGDVLSILDCCFASGAATKGTSEEFRTYQLLAASSAKSPTSGPGDNSFTTALCDSLEELLSEGGTFPVTKLWEAINQKRTTQASLIWDQLKRYKRCVQLGRMDATEERDKSFKREDPEKASLSLRFSLRDDDLTREQIEMLARHLPEACKNSKVAVRRLDWIKMETTKRKPDRFAKAVGIFNTVNKVHKVLKHKTSVKRNNKAQETNRVRGKKRTNSPEASLKPSKRQLRSNRSASPQSPGSGLCTPISPTSVVMDEVSTTSCE